jgi:cell division protein FtsQ
MDRSLAGSSPLIRTPRVRVRARARRRARVRLRAEPRLPAALGTAAGSARALLVRAWRRRTGRIALVLALVATPLLGGGYMWLRNSSLVAVRHVHITGVRGPEAAAIESALLGAAHGMTTLHVRPAALRAAVSAFPVVREIHASPSFPNALRITVVEQPPVAALLAGGVRTAVAADGVALGPALLAGGLPTVPALAVPQTGHMVAGWIQRSALALLGAAPSALAKRVASAYWGPRGITVAMRNGLLAYFGDASLPHAKWLALARVLADPSSAGAAYVDVRVPARPAAGFGEGSAPNLPAAAGEGANEQATSGEASVNALAAGLAAGSGVNSSAPAAEVGNAHAGEPSERAHGGSEHASEHGAEAGSERSSETGAERPTEGVGESESTRPPGG